jgi:transposase
MASPPTSIGIDVAKDHLDIAALPSGEAWRIANDPDGIDALVRRLTDLPATLIAMEGTGGHEHAVAAALAAAGLAVAVVNPRQVRDFARATGELAKTDALDADALDAQVLALFAERVRPEPRALPDAPQRALEALLSRRRQLIDSWRSGTGCSWPTPLSRRA